MFGGCTQCYTKWETRDEFLGDPHVAIEALVPDLTGNNRSKFSFRHNLTDCGAEIQVPVSLFEDLRREASEIKSMLGLANCPGHCRDVPNLEVCSVVCMNASDRVLGHILRGILDERPYRSPEWPLGAG